jgi:hypothetical protein
MFREYIRLLVTSSLQLPSEQFPHGSSEFEFVKRNTTTHDTEYTRNEDEG